MTQKREYVFPLLVTQKREYVSKIEVAITLGTVTFEEIYKVAIHDI